MSFQISSEFITHFFDIKYRFSNEKECSDWPEEKFEIELKKKQK